MTIGERIKERRLEKKMSLDDLAKVTKVARQTIYKYENNIITNIPTDKIEIIAKVLGVSPGYLMGWEKTPYIELDIPKWYSLENLSQNELHDSSIDLIDKIRMKYPNDIDISKICSNLSIYIAHTNNLMLDYADNTKEISDIYSVFPRIFTLYYDLNEEGQELANNYLEMLCQNNKYSKVKEDVDVFHDDKQGYFAFKFNNIDNKKK